MEIAWDRTKRMVFMLEVHELFNLLMILLMFALYEFKLKNENLPAEFIRLTFSAGIAATLTTLIIFLIFATILVLPKGSTTCRVKFIFRIMASYLIMLFMFEAITHYISALGIPMQDRELTSLDNMIFFGKQPAVWLEPMISNPVTLFLSGVYFSWFLFTYGSIFLMWYKNAKAVIEYTTAALMTFYTGYLIYMLVPAVGPIFTYPYTKPLGGLASMISTGKIFPATPDVFPSLHTAISVVMLVLVWKYCRRFTWLYAIVAFLIIFSTLYLRIHYGIDVIAGIVLAVITTWLSPMIIKYWQKNREQSVEN